MNPPTPPVCKVFEPGHTFGICGRCADYSMEKEWVDKFKTALKEEDGNE
jgi:hypothetical protein